MCGRFFEFSIRSEICRGQIRMNGKIDPKKANFVKGAQHPPLAMPNSTNTPVSHIILNGSMYKWNPASGILNELSDCILYRQTNETLWINFSMFFLEN